MTDTTDRARERQLDVFAKMAGADKVRHAFDMAEQSKAIAIDGIRARNPELSEAEIRHVWLRLLHGERADRLGAAAGAGS